VTVRHAREQCERLHRGQQHLERGYFGSCAHQTVYEYHLCPPHTLPGKCTLCSARGSYNHYSCAVQHKVLLCNVVF